MIRLSQDGEVVFTADETSELVGTLKEIFNTTEIGQTYKKEYYVKARADEDAEKLVAAAMQIAGGPAISSRHLVHALTLLIDSGELKAKNLTQAVPLEEPAEDTRPRGRDGKLLTDAQLQWQEYRTWSETASSSERKLRMQSDPGYATYVRKAYQAEMNQPVGDAVTPVGDSEKKIKPSAELVDFAHKYNRTPSDSLKPRGGYVQLVDAPPMLYSTFISLVERAAQARLL